MELWNRTLDLNLILVKLLFVTGITTVCRCTISINYPYQDIAIHKLDVNCLSETYLNTSISNDDDNLEVPCYNLFRAEHRSNTKGWCVCIYYRYSLPLKILGIHCLQECINFEIIVGGKQYIFVSLYHSPNQSHKILNVHTKTNEQERAGTNWNELKSPETSWNHLERAGITSNEMDSATNWHKK